VEVRHHNGVKKKGRTVGSKGKRTPRGALDGVRVLEYGPSLGWYCGKLLADLGADVVRIEPPGGDPERKSPGPAYLYASTNKRSVVLDLARRDGKTAFRRLAAAAAIVLDGSRPGHLDALGIGFAKLRARNRSLVWTALSGFGLTGPHAGYAASDLVIAARGGALPLTGEASDPPVNLAGDPSWKIVSTVAAAASLIALREAAASGSGQLVDVSALDCVAAVTHICGAAKFREDGIVAKRRGTSLFASVPSGAYRCSDAGYVYLMVNRPAHWRELARWVNETTGNAEILDAMFAGPSSARQPYRELLDLFIGDHFTRMTAADAYDEAQRRHLAVTPVHQALDVATDPQLAARRFFVDVAPRGSKRIKAPGAPYRLSATPWRIGRTLAAPGQHTRAVLGAKAWEPPAKATARRKPGARRPPLSGLRVLELTAGMAGPWIGRFMAYCGADVIKVESRAHRDVTRLYVSPRDPDAGEQEAASPWFTDWNAGKRFVALDLSKKPALAIVKQLVAHCDVVVCNFAAGALDRLGLGHRALKRIKPDIVVLASTGLGATGPRRDHVTWGPNIEALSGLAALSGFPERECTITQYAYPDAVGALHGLVAVMAALQHRDHTGNGQAIDLSQYEATVASLGAPIIEALAAKAEPVRRGNASVEHAPHGCYPCRGEDRWCAIAVTDDAMWNRLCATIGRSDLGADGGLAEAAGRVARHTELDAAVAAWTSSLDAYEVESVLQGAGVAAGVVQRIDDQLDRDLELAARGFFEEIPRRSGDGVLANGVPLRFTETPGSSGTTGARIGADNDAVFRELLGLSEEEIESAIASGAIETQSAE
jgi:crotonobetainyl-CoA:carnitine CoA-transferase CaiB-like acyl-CoA transferase